MLFPRTLRDGEPCNARDDAISRALGTNTLYALRGARLMTTHTHPYILMGNVLIVLGSFMVVGGAAVALYPVRDRVRASASWALTKLRSVKFEF